MLVEKEIRDDVEKMMARMVEECVMAEAKEENNKKIKNLENKLKENLKQQEQKNSELQKETDENQRPRLHFARWPASRHRRLADPAS